MLQLRLKQGMYRQSINVRVPELYPEEAVQIDIKQSSFPADISYMYKAQADEIARRCAAGFSPEQALQNTSGFRTQVLGKPAGDAKERLNANNLKNLKHDVNVLKQISDLRNVASTGIFMIVK